MFTIFGHSGFLGSNIIKSLRKEKIYLPPRNKFIFKKNLGHIIYCIGSDNWKKEPINSFDANLGYLPLIVRNNKFKSFTYISSCRIYNNSSTTSETSSFKVSPNKSDEYYNMMKILSENFLFSSIINFKIIRVSNILGYSPKSTLVFPMFVKDAISKKQITISINKNSVKDFIHIDDVVQLIIKIIKRGKSNIYNLASGKNIKLITLANMIKSKIGCSVILKNQSIKIMEPKINIKKIEEEFNFKPKKIFTDFDDILKKYQNN